MTNQPTAAARAALMRLTATPDTHPAPNEAAQRDSEPRTQPAAGDPSFDRPAETSGEVIHLPAGGTWGDRLTLTLHLRRPAA